MGKHEQNRILYQLGLWRGKNWRRDRKAGKVPHFLSEYYKKRIFQRRLIVGAVSYPIIILITALIVLTFMVAVVVPMFKEVYKWMGGDLPYLTKLIISLSNNFDVVAI